MKRWFRTNEAVKYSGLSANTLRKYADIGLIRADRTCGGGKGQGHRRFDRESIDAYFSRSERKENDLLKSINIY